MSDPFDPLRLDPAVDLDAPDVGVIKSRARKIVRRRQVGLGAGAAIVAVIALVGIVVRPGAGPEQLASRDASSGTPSVVEQESGTISEDSAGSEIRKSRGAAGAAPAQAPADRPKTAAGRTSAVAAGSSVAAPQLELTLQVKEQPVTQRGADMTLKACNPGSASVTREFPSGQRYDFAVSRNDEIVWRWSDGRAFTQAVGTETWKAKECKTWTEAWNGVSSSGAPAASGSYEAVGVLTTHDRERTKSVSFCLDVC